MADTQTDGKGPSIASGVTCGDERIAEIILGLQWKAHGQRAAWACASWRLLSPALPGQPAVDALPQRRGSLHQQGIPVNCQHVTLPAEYKGIVSPHGGETACAKHDVQEVPSPAFSGEPATGALLQSVGGLFQTLCRLPARQFACMIG